MADLRALFPSILEDNFDTPFNSRWGVFGNTYFVAKHGNNDNNGNTINTPFLTIQRAIAEAGSNDLVVVLDQGEYTENLITGLRTYIDARNATLRGSITIGNCTIAHFNRIIGSSNDDTILKNVGCTGRSIIIANQIRGGGFGGGVVTGTKVAQNLSTEGSLIVKSAYVETAENGSFIHSVSTGGESELTAPANEWTGEGDITSPANNVWVNSSLGALAQWGTTGVPLTMADVDPEGTGAQSLIYEFASAQTITHYSFFAHTGWVLGRMPSAFKVYGWNGTAWVEIDDRVGVTYNEGENEFAVPTPTTSYDKIGFVWLTTPDTDRVTIARVSLTNDASEVGGNIEYNVERLLLEANSTGIDAQSITCDYNGYIGEVGDNGGTATLATVADGSVSIFSGKIDVDTVYAVSGGSLYINCINRKGTEPAVAGGSVTVPSVTVTT